MCMSSAPTAPQENKPVEYLHNKYLDGYTIAGTGATQGRNSLRVDLNSPTQSGVATPSPTTPTTNVAATDPLTRRTTQPLLPSPGMVVPTIGGSLAGTIGGSVTK